MPIAFPRPGVQRPHSPSGDSYPSLPSSDAGYDSEEEAAMIQEEWEESLRQMEVVLSIIIIPFFGKWYGRQFSYWGECEVKGWESWGMQVDDEQLLHDIKYMDGHERSGDLVRSIHPGE